MKITLSKSIAARLRHGERGMAVIVIIIIISILLIYIGGNLRTLHLLRQDLKQIEQKQISRFKMSMTATNAATSTNSIPVFVLQPSP